MPKLFISYRRKSSDFMYRVAERLTAILDADVFYDFTGMDDNNFETSLMQNLRACDAVLVIVTEHTFDPLRIHHDDDWVRREIAEALRLEKPIVLALYEGLTPPPDLPDDIRDIRKKHGLSFYREPWLFEPCIGALVDFMCRSTVLRRKTDAAESSAQAMDTQFQRQQFIEALDSLDDSPEKAWFILEALREAGYKPNSRGVNLDMLIDDAREAAEDRQARKDAALEYEDISELVKRPATRKHGLNALAEWRNTYPKLAHALDNAKLLGMLGDGSLPVSSPPPLEPVISSPMIAHDRKAQDKVVMTKPSALQAAIERANDFIRSDARNSDWTPFIAPLSDLKIPEMPFCIVPTGTFQMGADDLTFLETPVHAQTFEQPFYIAQYPVTNRQWAVGVSAGIVKEPQGRRALAWYNDRHMANAPVIGITWYEAQKFVTWVGCRLPTEREWEYAARGVENLTYPWGNKWDVTKPVWEGHSGGYPNDVTTKPTGASWVGAAHLSGNVWEWCGSAYGAYPYPTDGSREQEIVYRADVRYVLRGGSWNDGSKEMRSAYRSDYSPVSGSLIIGLRCARSL